MMQTPSEIGPAGGVPHGTRRLLGPRPRPILFSQSTPLRTLAPDEPLLIDSFADVAPEPSGCATRGRRTWSQEPQPSSTYESGLGTTALRWLVDTRPGVSRRPLANLMVAT
jgi:hypothetical protein